jgi:hypothetical protein
MVFDSIRRAEVPRSAWVLITGSTARRSGTVARGYSGARSRPRRMAYRISSYRLWS